MQNYHIQSGVTVSLRAIALVQRVHLASLKEFINHTSNYTHRLILPTTQSTLSNYIRENERERERYRSFP